MNTQKNKAYQIYKALQTMYPEARCGLNYENSWQLLVATILSAQCTDKKVNHVTPDLFLKYPTPEAMAQVSIENLEQNIRSIGLFRSKAKHLKKTAEILTLKWQGSVPSTMEDLTALPGVGRKTANVVLGNWFSTPMGIVVDTHVKRLSSRLGLTEETTPEKIEKHLCKLYPQKQWTMLSHLLISHGRALCTARNPHCLDCSLQSLCPFGQAKNSGGSKKI